MTRRWFNVGVVKIPHAERDVAHDVLGDRPDETAFQDIVGADTPDADDRFPVGSNCTYRAALTDEEAERFRQASNCRYVSEDVVLHNILLAGSTIPGWRVRSTLGIRSDLPANLAGTNVNVAIVDVGSSSAARNYMNQTLVGRGVFSSPGPPTNETYPGQDHGSLCASAAVPYGGRLLDAVVTDATASGSDGTIAQGIAWAGQQGAKVISGSIGYWEPTPATLDAINSLSGLDVVTYFATGNDALDSVLYPARYSTTIPYHYSVGGFDMSTGYRWAWANHTPQITGIAPSIMVRGVSSSGTEGEWQGTSAACPLAANLCARLIGAGVTARQAGAALAATGDQRGYGTAFGGGLFSLVRAAAYLGIPLPPTIPTVTPRRHRTGAWIGAL